MNFKIIRYEQLCEKGKISLLLRAEIAIGAYSSYFWVQVVSVGTFNHYLHTYGFITETDCAHFT